MVVSKELVASVGRLNYWETLKVIEEAKRGRILRDSPFYDLSESIAEGLIKNIVLTTDYSVIEVTPEEYKRKSTSNLYVQKRGELEKIYKDRQPDIYAYFVRNHLNLELRDAINRGKVSPIIETNVHSPFI